MNTLFHRSSSVSGGVGRNSLPVQFLSISGGPGDSLIGANPALHAVEALPPVEVTNPVLANLELANSLDPRRHRRTDSKLSNLSIGSLHR